MRGADGQTGALFSYLSPEGLVPNDHPLRLIRPLVNAALEKLSPAFDQIYALTGRAAVLHVWTSGNRGQRREATIVPRSER